MNPEVEYAIGAFMRWLQERGLDSVVITLDGSADLTKGPFNNRYSNLSGDFSHDELLLRIAAQLSPVFAPFLGEAILNLHKPPTSG